MDNLQLEDVVTIKTDSSASDVRQTALAWSPLADGRDGETAIRYVEMGTFTVIPMPARLLFPTFPSR